MDVVHELLGFLELGVDLGFTVEVLLLMFDFGFLLLVLGSFRLEVYLV
jgi:hypothetical protein